MTIITSSKIEAAILSYLEERKSPFIFDDLYKALNFSKQGIRNRIYEMIDDGIVERLGQISSDEYKRPRACFRFKLKYK